MRIIRAGMIRTKRIGGHSSRNWWPQFKELVATVDGGMKGLRKLGYSPQIVGMLWQQGENDAFDGTKVTSEYGYNLYHFIHRVRYQFHAPHMLFVYGLVIPNPNMGLFTVARNCRALIRMGEREVAHNSDSPLAVHSAYLVNTNDLELRAQDPWVPASELKRDHLHFGTMGQIDLGYLYADCMYRHQTLLPPHFH